MRLAASSLADSSADSVAFFGSAARAMPNPSNAVNVLGMPCPGLSALEPGDLARAIAAQDKAMVARANGVGPKLAERIVRELKDKIGGVEIGGASVAIAPSGSNSSSGASRKVGATDSAIAICLSRYFCVDRSSD